MGIQYKTSVFPLTGRTSSPHDVHSLMVQGMSQECLHIYLTPALPPTISHVAWNWDHHRPRRPLMLCLVQFRLLATYGVVMKNIAGGAGLHGRGCTDGKGGCGSFCVHAHECVGVLPCTWACERVQPPTCLCIHRHTLTHKCAYV